MTALKLLWDNSKNSIILVLAFIHFFFSLTLRSCWFLVEEATFDLHLDIFVLCCEIVSYLNLFLSCIYLAALQQEKVYLAMARWK